MPNYQAGGAFVPTADYLLTGDFVVPGQRYPVTRQAIDGVIPILAGLVVLTKGSAAAMTLAAPSAAQEGIEMTLLAGTAFAHVVTATGLIQDGVTGGAKTTLTFAAFVGSAITLLAITTGVAGTTGTWYVKSLKAVVVT